MEVEITHFRPLGNRSSLAIFSNSLKAFLLREIKDRFGRTRLGYFWAILDPMLSVVFFVAIHGLVRGNDKTIYGEAPLFFFTYSSIAYYMFMHTVSAQNGKLGASRGLFNYRQIRPIDVLLASAIIEFGLMVVVLGLFVLGCWLFGAPAVIDNIVGVIAASAGLLAFGFALGLAFEVHATVMPDLRRIFAVSMRPMFFISGLFFSIEMISDKYRAWLLWNPVLHLVDMMRGAALGGYESPGSWGYVIVATTAVLFIGLAGYRRHMSELA